MRLVFCLIAGALAFSACASPNAGKDPPFEFGKLRASLNGKEFAGIFGPSSVVAIWNATASQMQIEGDNRSRGRRTQLVRLNMRCGAMPTPGTYPIGNFFSAVRAEAYIAPTLRQQIWPLHGSSYRAFVSDSMPAGNLMLDTVDSTKGVIRGRFKMALRTLNRTPAETLSVSGTFFGQMKVVRNPFPRPGARLGPQFRTDCEAIRNAVSM